MKLSIQNLNGILERAISVNPISLCVDVFSQKNSILLMSIGTTKPYLNTFVLKKLSKGNKLPPHV